MRHIEPKEHPCQIMGFEIKAGCERHKPPLYNRVGWPTRMTVRMVHRELKAMSFSHDASRPLSNYLNLSFWQDAPLVSYASLCVPHLQTVATVTRLNT